MESVKHRTVTANGIRQHYIDAGQGPTVVLLQGFFLQTIHGGTRFRS
jgi:haloacetate dehalogenase